MANQKLNEVTTVPTASINNVKTFLAVMNDGSIQQMSKEDMATVLGGLLGNPLGFKQILTHSDDLNNIYDGVFSYLNEDKPSNSYGTNTTLIQLTTKGRIDKWQVAFCANERKVAIRLNYSGNWGNWKNVVTDL